MTTDEFAETTRHLVPAGSFHYDYQPTAIFPARKELLVLTDAPPDLSETNIPVSGAVRLRQANVPLERETQILGWARKHTQGDEEFLVAYKVDGKHLKVIRCVAGEPADSKTYVLREP